MDVMIRSRVTSADSWYERDTDRAHHADRRREDARAQDLRRLVREPLRVLCRDRPGEGQEAGARRREGQVHSLSGINRHWLNLNKEYATAGSSHAIYGALVWLFHFEVGKWGILGRCAAKLKSKNKTKMPTLN